MDNKLLAFLKHMGYKIFVEPIVAIKDMLHALLYPKAWFYAIFIVFVLRLLWVKELGDQVDRVLAIALVVIIVWREYKEWHDEYLHQERQELREKAVEQMKGK